MAHTAYLKVIGKTQGLISQGCNTNDSIGGKAQDAHKDEITILACRYSLERHGGLTKMMLKKPIDKASPLLGNAFAKQEHLQCEIRFYRTNEQGYNEQFYSIELVDALIQSLSFEQPDVLSMGHEDLNETLGLTYKDIIWKHNLAGTEGYETWVRQ